MGCFNVMGFHSHIPICAGEKTALFLCLRNKKASFNSCNIYHALLPIAPPIIGKYDDYGRIDEIERDANVELIENFFSDNIETIINVIDDFQNERHVSSTINDKINAWNLKLSTEHELALTLEHYDVYKSLINTINQPYAEICDFNLLLSTSVIGRFWMEKLGFIEVECTIPNFRRYKHPENDMCYTSIPKYGCPKIYSDNCNDEPIVIYHGIPEFIKKWHDITGIQLELDKYNSTIDYVGLCWDYTMELIRKADMIPINEIREMIKSSFKYQTDLKSAQFFVEFLVEKKSLSFNANDWFKHALYDDISTILASSNLFTEYNNILLLSIYHKMDFYDDKYKNPICDMIRLHKSLNFLHIPFGYSMNGGQSSNNRYYAKLHTSVMKVIHDRIVDDEDE